MRDPNADAGMSRFKENTCLEGSSSAAGLRLSTRVEDSLLVVPPVPLARYGTLMRSRFDLRSLRPHFACFG